MIEPSAMSFCWDVNLRCEVLRGLPGGTQFAVCHLSSFHLLHTLEQLLWCGEVVTPSFLRKPASCAGDGNQEGLKENWHLTRKSVHLIVLLNLKINRSLRTCPHLDITNWVSLGDEEDPSRPLVTSYALSPPTCHNWAFRLRASNTLLPLNSGSLGTELGTNILQISFLPWETVGWRPC